jgi:hypothetical protein
MRAHLPALATLPEFSLKAVSTSRPESAAAARDAFGVDAFDNVQALVEHPAVDLVTSGRSQQLIARRRPSPPSCRRPPIRSATCEF